MGGGRREEISVDAAIGGLTLLGCPNVRRGEGSDEWKATRGTYKFTPDIIAGPLLGGGNSRDFYIDVVFPRGEQFVNPKAGDPAVAAMVTKATSTPGETVLGPLGNFEAFYGPISNKLTKYSGSRAGSPMNGIVMYLRPDRDVRQVFAAIHSYEALDQAFGISHFAGEEASTIRAGTMNDTNALSVVAVPMEYPLSFLLWIKERDHCVKLVLIINAGIIHPDFEWAGHDVVEWLRTMVDAPVSSILKGIETRWPRL